MLRQELAILVLVRLGLGCVGDEIFDMRLGRVRTIQNGTEWDTHLEMCYLRFELTHLAFGLPKFVLKADDLILLGLNFGRQVASGSLSRKRVRGGQDGPG